MASAAYIEESQSWAGQKRKLDGPCEERHQKPSDGSPRVPLVVKDGGRFEIFASDGDFSRRWALLDRPSAKPPAAGSEKE